MTRAIFKVFRSNVWSFLEGTEQDYYCWLLKVVFVSWNKAEKYTVYIYIYILYIYDKNCGKLKLKKLKSWNYHLEKINKWKTKSQLKLVMLHSWTTRSFWTNLLGERIVLVHVIHWLIFLVHWNPSLQSSVALLALVCGLFHPVKDWLNLEPIAFEYEMWEHVICWI